MTIAIWIFAILLSALVLLMTYLTNKQEKERLDNAIAFLNSLTEKKDTP